MLASPTGLAVNEPWFLVSNCEQLFRDQKSGIFQLESSGLQDPERILEAHPAAAA